MWINSKVCKHNATPGKVSEPSPEQEPSRTIKFSSSRSNGKQINALMMFIENGREGKKTVYATPEGNFLSPAMVEIEKAKSYAEGYKEALKEAEVTAINVCEVDNTSMRIVRAIRALHLPPEESKK